MPTPIYRVEYSSQYLPGFLQNEDVPLGFRTINQAVLNRQGGLLSIHGADVRRVQLQFIVMSTLGSGTELAHLANCKAQVASAATILSPVSGVQNLKIGNLNKVLKAIPTGVSAPLSASRSRALRYDVEFLAEPYWLSISPVTGTFSGNSTVNMTMAATRETYPYFTIPSGVTAFIATHSPSGKIVSFTRGTASGIVTVNCADFRVLDAAGADASRTMNNVNYGIRHTTGAGTFSVVVTGYAGSGTVQVDMWHRYEWND